MICGGFCHRAIGQLPRDELVGAFNGGLFTSETEGSNRQGHEHGHGTENHVGFHVDSLSCV
jgi:hypothetical protein